MKKFICTLTAASVLGSTGAVLPALAETSKQKDIVILFTNDVHCGVDVNIGYDGLALYKREMEATHDNVVLVDAGDAIQGEPIGGLSKGAYITEIMNTVGYDVAVPGNHEFDYSIPTLLERREELDCGYISCNFISTETGKTVFDPYSIVDLGDVQIGFVGVTTPETFIKSTPVFFQNDEGEYIYSFCQDGTALYDVVQTNVDKVRSEGADYVILVAHLGENDVTNGWTAMDVAANTNGIDALIDGHSHEVTPSMTVQNKYGKDVTIAQTGTKLANIGKLTISQDGSISTELVNSVPAPTEDMGFDEASWGEADDREGRFVDTAANLKLHELEAKLDDLLSQKIGETGFTLYSDDPETGERRVRNGETNVGDFLADVFKNGCGTDIAFLNGGGIRATIKEGDISYKDILTVMPFGNKVVTARVTGAQIRDYLEYTMSAYPNEAGHFPAVSGIEFTVDKSVESTVTENEFGEFTGVSGEYRVRNIRIGGEPIDLDRTYTAASIDYLLKNGGDGFVYSGKCEILSDNDTGDAEFVSEYIKTKLNGVIPEEYSDPYGQGRIRFIDGRGNATYFGKEIDEETLYDDEALKAVGFGDTDIEYLKNGYDVVYGVTYDYTSAVSYDDAVGESRAKLDEYLTEHPLDLYDSIVAEFFAARIRGDGELETLDGITNAKGQFGITPDNYGSGEEMLKNGTLKLIYLGSDSAVETNIYPIDDPRDAGNIWFEYDYLGRGDYALLYQYNSDVSDSSVPDSSSPDSSSDSSSSSSSSSSGASDKTTQNPNTGAGIPMMSAVILFGGAMIAAKKHTRK